MCDIIKCYFFFKNWYKLNNPSGLRNFIWRLFPGGRYGHTVAVINEDTPEAIMMMIGGYPVYDCWIYNVRDQKWKKVLAVIIVCYH